MTPLQIKPPLAALKLTLGFTLNLYRQILGTWARPIDGKLIRETIFICTYDRITKILKKKNLDQFSRIFQYGFITLDDLEPPISDLKSGSLRVSN